jgi:hypothetical protein
MPSNKKGFLNRGTPSGAGDKTGAGDDRFAAADKALAGGGYAADQTNPTAAEQKPKTERRTSSKSAPTSWNASPKDRELVTQAMGELMTGGQPANRSQIVSCALDVFSKLSKAEKAAIYARLFGG